MFGWIDRIWHWGVTNVGDPVSSWVRDFVRGIFGWLHDLFGHVGDAWHSMFLVGLLLDIASGNFGAAIASAFSRIFKIAIPRLIDWASKALHILGHDLSQFITWVGQRVAQIIARIEAAVKSTIAWVIQHVWTPLLKDFLAAWKWITTHGELVFYYITHPDKLALLIFDSLLALLEKEAWAVGSKLGKFFVSLVIHNLRQFVSLVEDILMAVF